MRKLANVFFGQGNITLGVVALSLEAAGVDGGDSEECLVRSHNFL